HQASVRGRVILYSAWLYSCSIAPCYCSHRFPPYIPTNDISYLSPICTPNPYVPSRSRFALPTAFQPLMYLDVRYFQFRYWSQSDQPAFLYLPLPPKQNKSPRYFPSWL